MLLGSKGGLTRFGDAVRNITTKKIVNKCDSYNILEIINQWRIKLGFVNLISEILEINKKILKILVTSIISVVIVVSIR
jgi:hypothetical protein